MSPRRLLAGLALAGLTAVSAGCTAAGSAPPTTSGTWVPAGCLDGAGTDGSAAPDLLYTGVPNAVGNAIFFATISGGVFSLSGDGSCSGLPVGAVTVVRATDQAAADTLCTNLGQGTATPFAGSAWTLPADGYSCTETVSF
jgi:hypothetical protein